MTYSSGTLGTLGQRVRFLRQRKGATQVQLAHPGLSDTYISLIENNKRVPASSVIKTLASRLGCSEVYLQTGADDTTVSELRTTLGRAQLALRHHEASAALGLFSDVLAHPSRAALPRLVREAQLGHAQALEEAGALADAVVEFQKIADEDEWANSDRLARAYAGLCRCFRGLGDLPRAIRVGEDGLNRLINRKEQWTLPRIVLGVELLRCYEEHDDLCYADRLARQLAAAAEGVDGGASMIAVSEAMASLAARRGDIDCALASASRAMNLAERFDPDQFPRALISYVTLLLTSGPRRPAQILGMLQRAEKDLLGGTGDPLDLARCLVLQARTEMLRAHPAAAAELAERAIALLPSGTPPLAGPVALVMVAALTALSEASLTQSRRTAAVGTLAEAAARLSEASHCRAVAQAWYDLAAVFDRAEMRDEQISALQNALGAAELRHADHPPGG